MSAYLHDHWLTTTFAGALRLRGMTAPMVLDGPINGDAFRAYTEQILMPTLVPGDVAIMDNLPAHLATCIRKAIQGAGASLRYLLPYLPDFNPTENAFFKHKALLRKAAAKTVDSLWDTNHLLNRPLGLQQPRCCLRRMLAQIHAKEVQLLSLRDPRHIFRPSCAEL